MDPYQFKCNFCKKVFDVEDIDVCEYCKEDGCYKCIDNRDCCEDHDE